MISDNELGRSSSVLFRIDREDGIFGELDEAGFAAFFLNLGRHSKKEVSFTLRDLEDYESVQTGLRSRLSDDIVIKPEFATMEARAFRTLFREVKH